MAAAVALELPLVEVNCPHLGPAEAFDGGVAHVGPTGLWYSVPQDERPCPFGCNQPIDDRRCIAIMPDGDWRWAHIDCAVFAKQGRSDMAIDAPWKRRERLACAKCGQPWDEGHVHTYAGVFCDDECTQPYEESVTDGA